MDCERECAGVADVRSGTGGINARRFPIHREHRKNKSVGYMEAIRSAGEVRESAVKETRLWRNESARVNQLAQNTCTRSAWIVPERERFVRCE